MDYVVELTQQISSSRMNENYIGQRHLSTYRQTCAWIVISEMLAKDCR